MARVVAVRVASPVDPGTLAAAMLEDVVDLAAGMQQVEAALVAAPAGEASARAAAWPGMAVLTAAGGLPTELAALERYGAEAAAVVTADAPDLPPLLVGKLFSALTSWPVAVCPSSDGSVVALAATLPPAHWLEGLDVAASDALALIRAGSEPTSGSVSAKAEIAPRARRGRYFFFCSGVPNILSGCGTPIDWCADSHATVDPHHVATRPIARL